jgi:ligand-binding sensor domain-containing protein/serine phosphatase RsbU (regulator of sigma subunit)
MFKRLILWMLCFCLPLCSLFSQQYCFKKVSLEEDLPQSTVFCLLEDSRGFIWMGTDGGGLSRFDGKKFETYTIANGLSGDIIRALCEDKKGNIWIGTDNGLTKFDGNIFTSITRENGLSGTIVLKIIEGNDGIIWVGTTDGGLSAIESGDSTHVTNFTSNNGLISNFIYDIFEDANNKLWLAMVGGVDVVEFSNKGGLSLKNIEHLDTGSEFILSIIADNNGTVWLGSHGDGLFKTCFDVNRKTYKVIPSSINNLFPKLIVWDMYLCSNGELWIATDKNGVIRLSNDKLNGEFTKENGLPTNQILSIIKDNEGHFWFGTMGKGAIMLNNEKFLGYGAQEDIKGTQIQNIFIDSDGLVYIATEEEFACFETEGDKIKKKTLFSSFNGISDLGVNAITRFETKIWIGTNNGIDIMSSKGLSEFQLNEQLPDQVINCFLADSHDNLWIGTNGGYCKYSKGKMVFLSQDNGLINNEVQTIIEDSKGRIWIGTMGGLARLIDTTYSDFNSEDGLHSLRINSLAEDKTGNIWIGTFGGEIYKYSNSPDSVPISLLASKDYMASGTINSLLFVNDSISVVGTDKGFDFLELNKDQSIRRIIPYTTKDGFTGGESNVNSIAKDRNGYIWFGTKNGLIRFDPRIDINYNIPPISYVTGIKLFFKDIDWTSKKYKVNPWSGLPNNLVLSYKENHVTFEFTGLSYNNPEDVMFSYCLIQNQTGEWSPFTYERAVPFSDLSPGNYIFKVRARNKYGLIGDTAEYSFKIRPPFWETKLFIISAFIIFLFLIYEIMKYRERKLINEKIKLESIIEERTKEVTEQKNEIARQRDIVTYQKEEITDSIHYAETIQRAILPEESILKSSFSDYFILFRPQAIVSGDFYWMSKKGRHIIFTAADCTGHGVPGAFMSMLGVSFLNKIVNESDIVLPDCILNSLRENIIVSLKQKGLTDESKDGMDIAICSVDMGMMKLKFAGANSPMIILREGNEAFSLIEIKGDSMPVGFHSVMNDFKCHEIDIYKNDRIFLFSDGFMDQLGGPTGRKFMKRGFLKMLLEKQDLDMESQKEAFKEILDEWINYPSDKNEKLGQIDDILIIGIKI